MMNLLLGECPGYNQGSDSTALLQYGPRGPVQLRTGDPIHTGLAFVAERENVAIIRVIVALLSVTLTTQQL